LPDGIIACQKIPIWVFLERFGMGKVGIFYGHLKYFMAICNILLSFGTILPFWYVVGTQKNLATPLFLFGPVVLAWL
jgi:hypothetical protein